MKKYVWVLKISFFEDSPRILLHEDTWLFDCEQSARDAMARLHEKISYKESCKMLSEENFNENRFSFKCNEYGLHYYGVQIFKRLVLTESEVGKFRSAFSIFL